MFEKLHIPINITKLDSCYICITFLSFRKGKVKPFDILRQDNTNKFVELFISMGDMSGACDIEAASEFVCQMYAQHKTRDVNEARYIKMLEMTGKVNQVN